MPPPIPYSTRTRNNRIIVRCAFVFIGLVVILGVTFIGWRLHLHAQLNAALAEIRAEHYPTDSKELNAWYPEVPASENAARVYAEAFSRLDPRQQNFTSAEGVPLELPAPTSPLTNQFTSDIHALVNENSDVLKLLHEAALRSHSRYPIDLTTGISTPVPHLKQIRRCQHLLTFENLTLLTAGDAKAAADSIKTSLALGASLDNEPLGISQLLNFSIIHSSCRSLERTLNHAQLEARDLQSLAVQFSKTESINRVVNGLIGDRAMYSEAYEKIQADPDAMAHLGEDQSDNTEHKSEFQKRQTSGFLIATGYFENDHLYFLKSLQKTIEHAKLSPEKWVFDDKPVNSDQTTSFRLQHLLSAMLLPSFARLPLKNASQHAYLRSSLTALAVERWRLANDGKIPTSLDVLIPTYLEQLPDDPFNGQPLHFKCTETGYTIYSVGENGIDDGGIDRPPTQSRNSSPPLDIVFRVEHGK